MYKPTERAVLKPQEKEMFETKDETLYEKIRRIICQTFKTQR